MIRSAASRARRALRTAADAIRSTVSPASLVRDRAVEVVPDPADVFTPDEMPDVETIETTAADYLAACDEARAADRGKRKSRKLLDRLPAGIYGRFTVERTPSSRTTVDLEAVRATYARLGLGPVPMKRCRPVPPDHGGCRGRRLPRCRRGRPARRRGGLTPLPPR